MSAPVLLEVCTAGLPLFQRGDVDANGTLDITDGISILLFLYQGQKEPVCLNAGDVDDNGQLQITDAVRIFNYLFLGGPAPAQPFPSCGFDATPPFLFGCNQISPACDASLDEFGKIAASFGILDTLAGKGASDAGNEWLPDFEGGPATEAELSRPHNALGDDAGNVYIVDKEAHGIRKVTPDGKIFTVAGTNEAGDGSDEPGPGTQRALSNPNGIWVRGDGTVYILDLDNTKVRRLSPDGTLRTLFVVPGLLSGRGLWVADDEQLAYVASGTELDRWTPSEGVTAYAQGFTELANLAVDSAGNVLVTDRAQHTVYKVSGPDEVTPIAGNATTTGGGDGEAALDTGLNEVRGIWIVEGGGYFLATHHGSQIWYVDTQGIIHLFLDGSTGTHAGDGEPYNTPGPKVSEIRSVTLDRHGNMLITENDVGFIRIVYRK